MLLPDIKHFALQTASQLSVNWNFRHFIWFYMHLFSLSTQFGTRLRMGLCSWLDHSGFETHPAFYHIYIYMTLLCVQASTSSAEHATVMPDGTGSSSSPALDEEPPQPPGPLIHTSAGPQATIVSFRCVHGRLVQSSLVRIACTSVKICIYMHTCIHTYIHTYTYRYVCTYAYISQVRMRISLKCSISIILLSFCLKPVQAEP